MTKKPNPWERQPGEGVKPYEYFCHYREQGQGRTVLATAEHFGKSINTIQKYSGPDNWIERARAWDDHIIAARDKAVVDETKRLAREHMHTLGLMRKLANMTLERTAEGYEDRVETPTTVKEAAILADKAVTLERLVTGEATGRMEAHIDVSKLEPGEAAKLLELLKKAGHVG